MSAQVDVMDVLAVIRRACYAAALPYEVHAAVASLIAERDALLEEVAALRQQPAPAIIENAGKVEVEPSAVRSLVAAANAVLALYPGDDLLWTLESAVRPFNATKPAECAKECPPQQVCDYCQIASSAHQPAPAVDLLAEVRHEIEAAQRELDTVTATDDAQSDGIGCAENALDRALAVLDRAQGVQS